MLKQFSVLLCALCTLNTATAQTGECSTVASRQVATTQYSPSYYTYYVRCGSIFRRRRRCARTGYSRQSMTAYREVQDTLFNCCSGYQRVGTSMTCQDINECSGGLHQCEQVCTNTEGSYRCSCRNGYRQIAHRCRDINECNERLDQCNHICTNTEGSYRCSCYTGYRLLNSHTCREIDECAENSHHCEQICTNTNGSYICSCRSRDRLNIDGRTCQAPPSPPQAVMASQLGAMSSTVSWSPPQHSDSSVQYNLFCSDVERRYTPYRFSSLHGTQKTLLGLHPYTNYTCCVIAINYAGEGERSCNSFLTDETEPSAAPNITEVNATSTSLELRWDELPVSESNGEILGYIIHYQQLPDGVNMTQNISETSISLMDLKPFSTYEFTIAAYTLVGLGPYGPFYQEQTDEDVPSRPPKNITSLLISPDSFLLEWSPPLETHWNGNITGYVLNLEKEDTHFDNQKTSDTNYTFTGLQQGIYYCSIAAQTRIGTGPFSERIELSNLIESETKSKKKDYIISISSGSSGAFLAILLICVAIVLVVVILKCRTKHNQQEPKQKFQESSHPKQTHQKQEGTKVEKTGQFAAEDYQNIPKLPPRHHQDSARVTGSLQAKVEDVEENQYEMLTMITTCSPKSEKPEAYLQPTITRKNNAGITGQNCKKNPSDGQYMPLCAATMERRGGSGPEGMASTAQHASGHYVTPEKPRARKMKISSRN